MAFRLFYKQNELFDDFVFKYKLYVLQNIMSFLHAYRIHS